MVARMPDTEEQGSDGVGPGLTNHRMMGERKYSVIIGPILLGSPGATGAVRTLAPSLLRVKGDL